MSVWEVGGGVCVRVYSGRVLYVWLCVRVSVQNSSLSVSLSSLKFREGVLRTMAVCVSLSVCACVSRAVCHHHETHTHTVFY